MKFVTEEKYKAISNSKVRTKLYTWTWYKVSSLSP